MGCCTSGPSNDTINGTVSKQQGYTQIIQNDAQNIRNHVVVPAEVKYKFLCLHGWRTSGKILEYQTGAFRSHTNIRGVFPDAPFDSTGDPYEGIKLCYPPEEFKYYEWINHKGYADSMALKFQMNQSVNKVITLLKEEKFDGILGFSQGGGVITAVLHKLKNENIDIQSLIQCVILISGIPPNYELEMNRPEATLSLPNLHIIGDKESEREQCIELTNWYSKDNQTILAHDEDHRIPTIKTAIYPKVLEWLKITIKT